MDLYQECICEVEIIMLAKCVYVKTFVWGHPIHSTPLSKNIYSQCIFINIDLFIYKMIQLIWLILLIGLATSNINRLSFMYLLHKCYYWNTYILNWVFKLRRLFNKTHQMIIALRLAKIMCTLYKLCLEKPCHLFVVCVT